MVYVLDINGNPLMPTTRYGHVRRLLRDGMAKVVSTSPFTIQLTYESTKITQDINLGVDAGSKIIGLSATTKDNQVTLISVIYLVTRSTKGALALRN